MPDWVLKGDPTGVVDTMSEFIHHSRVSTEAARFDRRLVDHHRGGDIWPTFEVVIFGHHRGGDI